MGVVYEAEDTRLGRRVALKVLPAHTRGDAAARARLEREARAAARLDHPNVGVVHEIGETDDGALFIAMALYDGGTLRDRMWGEPLPLDDAVAIARGVAAGLAAAHRAGVVHRDVKPENVVVTSSGRAKVIDFGIAKLAEAETLTRADAVTGTAHYMAPEQASGAEVDARADVWALGVVFYEMLAGHRPFGGEYAAAVLYQVAHAEPDPLSASRPDVPAHVEGVIDRCLQKNPSDRYVDAGGVLEALDLGSSKNGVASRSWPIGARARRSLVVAAALVAITVAAVVLFPRGSGARAFYESGASGLAHHYDSAHLTTAITALRRAVASDTAYAEAEAALSRALVLEGQRGADTAASAQARYHAERALQLDPGLAAGHEALGLVELWKGDPQEARAEFRLALHLDSLSVGAWRGVGDAYLAVGEPAAAENAYRRALQLDPDDWYTHHRMGYAYYSVGEYEAAAEAYGRVLELTPGNGDALLNRGGLLFALERFDEAEDEFRRLVSVRPDGDAHTNLGTSLFYAGEFRQAADQYERALRHDPGDYEKLGYLAASYAELGERERAAIKFREAAAALRASPGWDDDPQRVSELATYEAALGSDREASRLIESVAVPPPSSVYVVLNVASAYGLLGDPPRAAEWACTAAQAGYPVSLLRRTPALRDSQPDWEECLPLEDEA